MTDCFFFRNRTFFSKLGIDPNEGYEASDSKLEISSEGHIPVLLFSRINLVLATNEYLKGVTKIRGLIDQCPAHVELADGEAALVMLPRADGGNFKIHDGILRWNSTREEFRICESSNFARHVLVPLMMRDTSPYFSCVLMVKSVARHCVDTHCSFSLISFKGKGKKIIDRVDRAMHVSHHLMMEDIGVPRDMHRDRELYEYGLVDICTLVYRLGLLCPSRASEYFDKGASYKHDVARFPMPWGHPISHCVANEVKDWDIEDVHSKDDVKFMIDNGIAQKAFLEEITAENDDEFVERVVGLVSTNSTMRDYDPRQSEDLRPVLFADPLNMDIYGMHIHGRIEAVKLKGDLREMASLSRCPNTMCCTRVPYSAVEEIVVRSDMNNVPASCFARDVMFAIRDQYDNYALEISAVGDEARVNILHEKGGIAVKHTAVVYKEDDTLKLSIRKNDLPYTVLEYVAHNEKLLKQMNECGHTRYRDEILFHLDVARDAERTQLLATFGGRSLVGIYNGLNMLIRGIINCTGSCDCFRLFRDHYGIVVCPCTLMMLLYPGETMSECSAVCDQEGFHKVRKKS